MTRILVGPSRAVEFSTVMDTPSMHAPASASPSRRTPGNSQGPVTRWTRDVCKQLPSRFHPIWPSTTSIHPSIHPFGPGVPHNSRDAWVGWATRSGHHRQNCLLAGSGRRRRRGLRASSLYPCNVISHVRKPKREGVCLRADCGV